MAAQANAQTGFSTVIERLPKRWLSNAILLLKTGPIVTIHCHSLNSFQMREK